MEAPVVSRKAVRCRFMVFLLTLGLAGVPNETGAQDRRSHWGVTVGFSPRWTTPEALDTLLERLWDGSSIDFSGSEFRAGFVRGSELGGDAGVSFVRQPFNDGSELASAGVGYVTRGVVLTGVEAHKFTPFGVIRDRVQIGVDYGAGLGVFKGVVDAATAEGAVLDVRARDALGPWEIGVVPIGRFELAVAVIAAPGLKVRVQGGVNFPGVQTFSFSVNYLFGAR